jgi:hypothetical protein
MGNEPNWEHHPGKPPENTFEEISGLKEAIDATEKRISRDGSTPDLELHLNSLRERLQKAEEKIKKAA